MLFRSLTLAAALLTVSPLFAGNCGSIACNRVVHQQAYVAPIVATPQYVTQNIFYSVGDQVRYPAVAPQAVIQAQVGQMQRSIQRQQDEMRDLMGQYQQQSQPQPPQIVYVPMPTQQGAACATCNKPTASPAQTPPVQQPPTQPPPQQPQTPPDPEKPAFSMKTAGGVIEAKCLKCHGGSGQPKGDLDLRGSITCEQFHSAMQRLLTDDVDKRMPKGQPALTPEETAAAMKELSAMVAIEPPKKQ